MKTAIIIGHNAREQGYYSPYLQKSEFQFFSEMEPEMSKFASVYYHNPLMSSYSQRMRQTAARINQHDYHLVFALHFNSFNGQAHGVEALHFHTNTLGMQIAREYISLVGRQMGMRKRTPVGLHSPSQNGFMEIATPRATTVLLEPFFGDVKDDCDRFDAEKYISILRELTL